MNPTRGALLAAAIVFAAAAHSEGGEREEVQGHNLLQNGGFESLDDSWGRYVWSGPCAVDYSTEPVHIGERAMRLHCSANGRAAVFQKLQLTAGRYRLSGLLRGLNISEAGLWGRHTELLVLGPQGWQHTQPLRSGRFGWLPFDATFTLPQAGEVTLYLRLFSRGTLWADALRLVTDTQGETATATFGAELAATPSACEADQPICTPVAAAGAKTLSQFARQRQAPFLDSTFAAIGFSQLRGEAAIELSIDGRGWLGAYDFHGLDPDWSGYDYLSFNIHNDGPEFVDFSLEIWDAQSVGYWSRVNWEDRLAPGDNHFRVPLQIFVGERIQVKPSRRLRSDQIRRLVLSFFDSGRFRISELRLQTEKRKCQQPAGLKAFDFGADHSPLMFDFEPVQGTTAYAACRGHGLLGDGLWRIEDRRSPDNLWRDWISFKDDTQPDFRVDLEPGGYRVEVLWEDPGYWEWYHNYAAREVHAEGRLQCRSSESFNGFLDRYFRHAEQEDRPEDDTWLNYIEPRYQPGCVFDLEVGDGALDLAFVGSSPYAASINGLLIYPLDAAEAVGAWKQQLRQLRREAFAFDYRRLDVARAAGEADSAASLPPTAPFVLYARALSENVYLNSRPQPGELLQSLSATALRKERVVLPFVVYPQQDLGAVDALRVEGLPASIVVQTRQVRHLDERLTGDGTVFGSVPLLLDPRIKATLDAARSRQFLLELQVGAETPVGQYQARVRLQRDGKDIVSLPLSLQVEGSALPPSPIRHSVLGSLPNYTGGVWKEELQARVPGELAQILQLLSAAGLTALTGPQGVSVNEQGCDAAQALAYLAALKAHNFASLLNTYFSPDLAAATQWRSGQRAAHARAVIDCSQKLYGQHGYQLAWSLFDEPGSASAAAEANSSLAWFAQLQLQAPFMSSGFTSLYGDGSEADQARIALFASTDLPFITRINDAAPLLAKKAAGRPWGMYNNFGRWAYGLYGWMLHRRYGLTDISAFALHSMQGDHYYPLDGREGDWAMVYTSRDSRVLATLRLERLAAGITDFRYLALLHSEIEGAADSAAKKSAGLWLDELLDEVDLRHRTRAWSAQRLDAMRNTARQHLSALSTAASTP